MSTTCPAPFPVNGQTPVTHEQAMQRMRAVSHQLPAKLETNCESRLQVGIFFDGTNNNMKLDFEDPPPEKRNHTNIVKLFQAFPQGQQDKGFLPYYIPGVGTPFPEIGDNNHPNQSGMNWGSSFGEKGEHRIIWALTRMVNAPHQHVKGAKSLLIDNPSAAASCRALSGYGDTARRAHFRSWQDKLKASLSANKPRVVQINLSVFGFSRGAAEARVFVNWLLDVCEQRGGQYFFAGIELNLAFLGIFDTVASVGLANLMDSGTLAGHQSWADNNLEIHPAVRRCVHYVAAHEVRACFPLDSARVKSSYPSNALEVMYPGVHSDVGGGYAPNELGVAPRPSDNLSIIPGRAMYEAARNAGVPLTTWDKLADYVIAAWTPSKELIQAYNNYIHACGVGPGPAEAMHRQHMVLHHSYRYKWRREFTTRKMAYLNAQKQDEKTNLLEVQNRFIHGIGFGADLTTSDELPATAAARYEAMCESAGIDPAAYGGRTKMEIARSINPQRVTPAVEYLFDWFVHDSVAGFKANLDEYKHNKLGAAKFRTVFKGND